MWQDLVEKVMILRKAVEIAKGQAPEVTSGTLASQLSSYSGILAAQGSLTTAMNYLGSSSEVSAMISFALGTTCTKIQRLIESIADDMV